MKWSDDVVLFTDLDVPECQRRLNAELDEKRRRPWRLWAWGYGGSKEMLGSAGGQSFSFRPRKYASNWLAPTCHGRMYPQGGRTRIDAYFDRPSWSTFEAEQFFELVGYAFVCALILFSSEPGTSQGTLLRTLVIFAALVAYLFWYVRRALRRAKPEILEFLQKTLLAQIEPRP